MAPPNDSPKRRRLYVIAGSALLLVLLLAVALFSFAVWLVRTEAGLQFAAGTVERLSGGRIVVEAPGGRLAGPLRFDALRVETPTLRLRVRGVSLDWNGGALLDRHLDVAALSVDEVMLSTRPSEAPPEKAAAPDSLELPVSVSVRALDVGHLAVFAWDEAAPWPPAYVAPPPRTPAAGHSSPPPGAADSAAPDAETVPLPAPRADADAPRPDPVVPAPSNPDLGTTAVVPTFELSALSAALASDRRHHRIERVLVALPFGNASATAQIDGGAAPFPLSAALRLQGAQAGRAFTLEARADGDLIEPHLVVEAEGAGLAGSADVLAAPFAAVPLRRLQAHIGNIDPSKFAPAAPRAALRIDVDLVPEAGEDLRLTGPVAIVNGRPDTVDRGGLPIERVTARLHWTPKLATAEELVVELVGDGRVSGDVAWTPGADDPYGRVRATLALAAIDPRRLDARLPKALVAGSVEATGDQARQDAKLDVRIGEARVRADARFDVPSEADAPRRLVATGELERFDPHALVAAAPAASLNTSLKLDVALAATTRIDARFDLRPSRLQGRPLEGRGRVVVEGDRLADADVDVTISGNRALARGAWGGAGDRLELHVDAPALSGIVDGLGGKAKLDATVAGSRDRPAGTLVLFAEALRLPGGLRIGGVNAQGRLDDGYDGPVQLALGVTAVGRGEERNLVDRATVGIDGRGSAHVIDVAASGLEQDALRVRLEGGLVEAPQRTAPPAAAKPGAAQTPARAAGRDRSGTPSGPAAAEPSPLAQLAWRGRIVSLATTGRFPAKLTAPAGLDVAPDRVALGAAALDAGERGRIRLDETTWSPELIAVRGSLTGLAVALATRQDGEREARVQRDAEPRRGPQPLVLGAEWDLRLGTTAEGAARVFRESGDLRVGGEIPARLGLERLEARLTARENRLALAVNARGSELGELVGSATALAERHPTEGWRLAPDAALLGSGRLAMPSIAWLGRLLQENIVTGGSLAADFALAGTPSAPRASGSVDGRGLSLALVDQGLHLAGGDLRAEFDRDRLRLVRLDFLSPNRVRPRDSRVPVARYTRDPGRLSATGQIALDTGAGNFRFEADRLPILQRRDRWLVLSGEGTARSTWTSLDLAATLRGDAGYFEMPESPPPALSGDVVVLGREEPAAKGGFKLTADIRVLLGDNLYLSALGVDARLGGELRLRKRDGEGMTAVGTIATVGGTFRGYGQNLAIERGRINFQGPLDNPGLNVVALRKGLEVEAGLAIVGSARRPQVRLVSEPNVPDPEKLSWLVLGRAPAAGSGADLGMLLPAAQAMFGKPGGGMTDQMSRKLGFDQFSIGQGELTSVSRGATSRVVGSGSVVTGEGTVAGQVLSLGKRLSTDLFLSFEQSLRGAESLVKLTYQLSRQVSLVARGGNDNSADIYYTISFR